MKLKALLLDLDGTLVNTAPDMVATLNRILVRHNYPEVDSLKAANQVSNGAGALLELGINDLDTQLKQSLIQEFLADYANNVAVDSHFYDGMLETLEFCENNNIRWGVVTNKPFELSRSLLSDLGVLDRCSILLGGDSMPVKKPDPAPLLHCCMVLNLAASDCLYVGDHERDILAGKNAGMDTAVANWGYIDNTENPTSWGADFLLNEPNGLLKLITERLTG